MSRLISFTSKTHHFWPCFSMKHFSVDGKKLRDLETMMLRPT